MAVLPGVLRARNYVMQWSVLLIWIYVTEGLVRASGFIRHQMKQQVHLKRVPALGFEIDRSLEYGSHMNSLFAKIKSTSAAPDEAAAPEGTEDDSQPTSQVLESTN